MSKYIEVRDDNGNLLGHVSEEGHKDWLKSMSAKTMCLLNEPFDMSEAMGEAHIPVSEVLKVIEEKREIIAEKLKSHPDHGTIRVGLIAQYGLLRALKSKFE